MTRTVLKFGGTSVASPTALESVARIVGDIKGDRVVVVSATAGTTDALHTAAREAGNGEVRGGGIERTREGHSESRADLLGVVAGATSARSLTSRSADLAAAQRAIRTSTRAASTRS